jgi:hypothetical protein
MQGVTRTQGDDEGGRAFATMTHECTDDVQELVAADAATEL